MDQPGFKPSNYIFIGGTEADDRALFVDKNTAGAADVFCGVGGSDNMPDLEAGDIFLGGAGDDVVDFNHGTFNGGDGNDTARFNFPEGTFNGGDGNDSVTVLNEGTTHSVENGV